MGARRRSSIERQRSLVRPWERSGQMKFAKGNDGALIVHNQTTETSSPTKFAKGGGKALEVQAFLYAIYISFHFFYSSLSQ